MIPKLSMAVVCFLFFLSLAHAQEGRSDVAVSAIGVFPKQSTGNDIEQNPTNSAGFLLSYRYAPRAHSAVELNYSFTRNTQYYTIVGSTSGPVAAEQGNVNEITGAYVLEGDRSHKLSPFSSAEEACSFSVQLPTRPTPPSAAARRPRGHFSTALA